MRGKIKMSDLELKGWSKIILKIIKNFDSIKEYYFQDLTKFNLCPANMITILENLGWKNSEMNTNGWQQDTWYYFLHPDYKFQLSLNYTGYTFEMSLSKNKKENEDE